MSGATWYDSRRGKAIFWGTLVLMLVGVAISTTVANLRIPWEVYLFGFLGATVYVFTSFAKRFDEAGRYRLRLLSRTAAVLPLVAGVYLLAFAFPGVSGEFLALGPASGTASVSAADRAVLGLSFIVGAYVNATLKAVGGLAERMLGLSAREQGTPVDQSESGADEND